MFPVDARSLSPRLLLVAQDDGDGNDDDDDDDDDGAGGDGDDGGGGGGGGGGGRGGDNEYARSHEQLEGPGGVACDSASDGARSEVCAVGALAGSADRGGAGSVRERGGGRGGAAGHHR
eukprot:442135-Rhodomonas_salina.3